MNTKKLTSVGLLVAMAIVIPYAVFFKVVIPPFTATLGSHVPMFLSMFLGPQAAILVGLGSALGFGMNLGVVVGARAFMHVFVGLIGAQMIKKDVSFKKVVAVTAPIHGLLEVMVVIPFIGVDAYKLFVVTGIGTMLHHFADAAITAIILQALIRAKVFSLDSLRA